MIDFDRTLFLVDGITDLRALKSKLVQEYEIKSGFRHLNCNGIYVTPECYAKRASSSISVGLHDRYSTFICIVDREKRRISSLTLCLQIKTCILNILPALNPYSLFVFSPDIMLENWIVADVVGIKKTGLINNNSTQESFDGQNGSTVLNGIMNKKYKKTIHAEQLFVSIRFPIASNNSDSFACFYNEICV